MKKAALGEKEAGLLVISIPSSLNTLEVIKAIRGLISGSVQDVTKYISDPPFLVSHADVINGYRSAQGIDLSQEKAQELISLVANKLQELGVKTEVIDAPVDGAYDLIPRKIAMLIANSKNVLLYGPKGAGKTAMTDQACVIQGYTDPEEPETVDKTRVKYFSMATLHPEDFVGIPAPDDEKFFKYLMLRGLLEAEVLILDEFNRAHPKVVNGVMQILHGRAINDMPLPNLKAVVACINPPDDGEYVGTDDLDEAVIDRFDHFIEIKAQPSIAYLHKVLGNEHVAKCLVDWYNTLDSKNKAQISPRRLEKMGRAWLDNEGIKHVLYKKKCTVSTHLLEKMFKDISVLSMESLKKDPDTVIKTLRKKDKDSMDVQFRVRDLINQLSVIGDKVGMAKVAGVLEVMDRDMIKSIERNPNLKKFVTSSIEQYGDAKTKQSVLNSFAEAAQGAELLRDKRDAAAARLAAGVDEKGIKI